MSNLKEEVKVQLRRYQAGFDTLDESSDKTLSLCEQKVIGAIAGIPHKNDFIKNRMLIDKNVAIKSVEDVFNDKR